MIHLTYTGSCTLDNQVIMCSNMNATLDQKVIFFDHIVGLRDVLGVDTKGPGGTGDNTQKRTYRYSPALARASISGPVPAENFQTILDKAIKGDEIELNLVFYKQNAPAIKIGKAIISGLTIDLKAGDVATFSLDITGAEYEESRSTSVIADCAKLVTWDQCIVEATPVENDISSFSITINNPPIPIYTNRWSPSSDASNGMMPQKIRIGMQEVTGTIGVYGSPSIAVPSKGTVTFNINGDGKTLYAVFTQPKDDASTGPYMRTITFNGVHDGTIWS